ncbi:uncharacterized protein G6M90_00g085290 [Metarhizium brunneum]|uniref:Uncharacterized protein n=1 Tax=Metarhizium brunneum TaxID=500148 RepID=A0A7D5V2X7_9HYPO
MPGGKYRVSVAGFRRDGISDDPSLETTYGHAMYHWGIWVEPKNTPGAGRLYHVEEHPSMNSAEGVIPGGWKMEPRNSDAQSSRRLIGRIMIGKLPAGKGYREIEALLRQVPAPVEGSSENCITWTMNAIRLLQGQEPTPWAEEFNVEEFMDHAYSRIKGWHRLKDWLFAAYKESYVKRKF